MIIPMSWRRPGAVLLTVCMSLVGLAVPAAALPTARPRARAATRFRVTRRPRRTVVSAPPVPNAGARTTGQVGADAGAVALTFDDGPDPRWTPQILDVLDAHHMHATLFVVGRSAARYPELIRAIIAHGDAVALHTWNHRRLTTVSAAGFGLEVDPEIALVSDLTGSRPTCLRPPFGSATGATVALAAARDLQLVQWSIDPRDWARPGVAAIEAVADNELAAGKVLLLHDGGGDRSETVNALGPILDHIDQLGLKTTTICGPAPAPQG